MQLLLLLIIFVWLGYALARSRTGKKIDQAVEDSLSWTENTFQRFIHRLGRDKTQQNQPVTFFQWVAARGEKYLPADVLKWINSLSDTNAKKFESSLREALAIEGINLDAAIQSPEQNGRMQIFVEAVVVYSRDYQNAVRAKPKKKPVKQEQPANDIPPTEEKAAAQKQPSRRKSAPVSSAPAHSTGGD